VAAHPPRYGPYSHPHGAAGEVHVLTTGATGRPPPRFATVACSRRRGVDLYPEKRKTARAYWQGGVIGTFVTGALTQS